MISKEKFGDYELYRLSNGVLEAAITNIGATWISLKFNGEEMIRSYKTPEAAARGEAFLCKAIGRYANRIGGSTFELDGKRFHVAPNEGENQLHGGPDAFDKRVWNAAIEGESVKMSIFSPDGDNGFPGNLTMSVTFRLDGASFIAEFSGETDAPTVFSPTVHPYFNLGGRGNVLNASLVINASGHLETRAGLIPTGKILPCEGKYDFSKKRKIEFDFDDAFVCPEEHCCALEMNGYRMDVYSNMPAIQLYTAPGMPEPYEGHDAVAIEPEFCPDSPNRPEFPSTVLRPDDKFGRYAEFTFSKI